MSHIFLCYVFENMRTKHLNLLIFLRFLSAETKRKCYNAIENFTKHPDKIRSEGRQDDNIYDIAVTIDIRFNLTKFVGVI